ncbi:MAG: NAD(P)-dependent oxidoreductase [Steroidobacteraceae bacterium]|jgi:3-hydroxyisobutyrate dehydrogenase-like beta-hydroxyacid dehydrogenase|nr:NAD(P)-dependent oxidoreductase [Steroidobacteraceae bacterium]
MSATGTVPAPAGPGLPRPRVGVAGLGIMGGAIARNLAAAGFAVAGFDPDGARGAALADVGVVACGSTAELAARTDVLLSSLPSDAALAATTAALVDACERRAATGSPATGSARLDWVELSTLSIPAKLQARDRVALIGIAMLDAPISGTGAQAERRDLAVYGSGDVAAWQRCVPVIDGFARARHHVGAFGHGMRLKLVANLLVAVHNVATAEALGLAARAGLDPAQALDLLGGGAGASRILALRGPLMVRGEYLPATMKLDVWQKDLALIEAFARAHDAATPLFDATLPLYDAAIRAGLGAQDTAAVFRILKEMSPDAAT